MGNLFCMVRPESMTKNWLLTTHFRDRAITRAHFNFCAAPRGTRYDSSCAIYSTEMKFAPGGAGSVFASTGLYGPIGLAFDHAGNLYAANDDNNTIERFTPDGTGWFFASTGANSAYGLAVDGANNLYAAIYRGHLIMKFTADGASSVFANTGANSPG
jgi:sugar lactone lactonase YvrE